MPSEAKKKDGTKKGVSKSVAFEKVPNAALPEESTSKVATPQSKKKALKDVVKEPKTEERRPTDLPLHVSTDNKLPAIETNNIIANDIKSDKSTVRSSVAIPEKKSPSKSLSIAAPSPSTPADHPSPIHHSSLRHFPKVMGMGYGIIARCCLQFVDSSSCA